MENIKEHVQDVIWSNFLDSIGTNITPNVDERIWIKLNARRFFLSTRDSVEHHIKIYINNDIDNIILHNIVIRTNEWKNNL